MRLLNRKDASLSLSSSKPPLLLKWRSSKFFIVMTVCLALFTDIFYYAMLVPVMPFSLTAQVGISEDQVQHWTAILLALYSLALFIGAPIAGIYADNTSTRRWPLVLGLIALAGSTFLLCFGKAIWLLVLGRLLQGFSAAVVWSVGCALLVDTMGTSAAGVAMGYVNISISVGLLIAPSVGGAVYASAGYYAVYYIAFGVIAVDVLLRLLMIEKRVAMKWLKDEARVEEPRNHDRVDVEKALKDAGEGTADREGVVSGLAKEESVAAVGTEQRPPELLQDATLPADEDLAQQNSKRKSKLKPLILLIKSRRLLAALFGILAQGIIMMGFDAVLALFVQQTFDWNSTAAGILFLALFLPGFVSPLIGYLADKYGAKYPALAGFATAIPILICLRFVANDSINDKVLLGFLLAILGTALCFSNTPLMAEMTYAIHDMAAEHPDVFDDRSLWGFGYGMFTMSFALGGVVGPLWAGYVNAQAGWSTMAWSFAVLAASAAVVTFLWVGPGKKGENVEEQAASAT